MSEITIPPEVAKAIYDCFEPGYLESIGLHPETIAANALKAWPGMIPAISDGAGRILPLRSFGGQDEPEVIILPLPEEPAP